MRSNTAHFLLLSLLVTRLSAMETQQPLSQRLYPLGDGKGYVQLRHIYGNDLAAVNAARMSFAKRSESFGKVDHNLLTALIRDGHETPFEQTGVQLELYLPRFLKDEWTKNNTIGVSYKEPRQADKLEQEFYRPQGSDMEQAEARYTKLAFACNMRSLFNFVHNAKTASPEMQRYATCIVQQVWPYFPDTLSTWCPKHGLPCFDTQVTKQEHNLTSDIVDPLNDGKSRLQLINGYGSDLDIINIENFSYEQQCQELTELQKSQLIELVENIDKSPWGTSVLDQIRLQFFARLPILVARQLMRQRSFSYNEQSARYTHMDTCFFVPTSWRNKSKKYLEAGEQERAAIDAETQKIYMHALEVAAESYEKLLELGVPRELARGVLGVSLYTQLYFACNLRALLFFAQLRTESHAQEEIQQYARWMLKLVRPHFPIVIDTWCRKHNATWLSEPATQPAPQQQQ